MRRTLGLIPLFALLAFAQAPKPIIIDTDAGSDDYMAIAFLLARADVKIEAITVVNGLAHVEPGVRNVEALIRLSGKTGIPVYPGRATPLAGSNEFPAPWRQTSDDLPGVTLPRDSAVARRETALAYYRHRLKQPARILALGPLTNLAEAIQGQPALAANITELVIMGGAVRVPGNLPDGGVFRTQNRTAEWNIFIDPTAASQVLRAVKTIKLVPLDVTNQVPIRMSHVADFTAGANSTRLGRFMIELLKTDEPLIRERYFYAWDPLAAAAIVEPKLLAFAPVAIEIPTSGPMEGRTTEIFQGRPNVQAALGGERPTFPLVFHTLFYNAFASPANQKIYDLLIQNGTVIDPKNGLNTRRDVAIKDGKIARVAENIPALHASKAVDAAGHYVTPGLIDIHVHVFPATGKKGVYNGDNSVYPDGHTLRAGVTTVVDCGSSGADEFARFKEYIIDRSKTRVLAWLNIVRAGMTHELEQQPALMDPKLAAATAARYQDLIVGFKTAHFEGPGWTAVDRALEAGRLANLPILVDFGLFRPERPYEELVNRKLRRGDGYTHFYLERVPMLGDDGKVLPHFAQARQRGVFFDVGHGGGSFVWRQAAPATKQGLWPDSISTDLHINSMVGGMKDMLNVMSKFLLLGMPLEEVIAKSTWIPAQEIRHPELGHLSVGAPADIAVLSLQHGQFGFVDVEGQRMRGTRKLQGELTIRAGAIVWDLNGLAAEDWDQP